MAITKYVLMLAIDRANGFVVGLTKKRNGLGFLSNRVTFPGGKVEAGETVEAAATRELREEAGIFVPEADWNVFRVLTTEDREVHMLVAASDKVLHARTCEAEPVWHLNIARHLEYAARQPGEYAPDFIECLTGALEALEAEDLQPA